MEESRRIIRATGVVSGATFLSRILGLIRDIVISWAFGASVHTDAFFVAFTIPNLLRRLFGEGSLTVSFIPVYTEYLTHRPDEAPQVVNTVATLTASALAFLTVAGVIFAPWIVRLQAFGWKDPEVIALAARLTRICFPYLFFICLVALSMGILNSHGHFAAPALAPCLLNVSIIACALLLSPYVNPPVLSLAIGVFLGGISQLLLQLPFLRAQGITFRPRFDLHHPALKRIFALMAPMVMGIAVFQVNQVVNRFLASFLPKGSISYLYYADRVFELPLGVFVIALGVAVLPSFSRLVAEGRRDEFHREVGLALRLLLFITLPAMVGMIVLRVPILNLLFQRGAFGERETLLTAQALLCYALGLWAYGGITVLSRAFYATGDARTPVKAAVAALLLNAAAGVMLMGPLRHAGLALANALSATLNVSLLGIFFYRKERGLRGREILGATVKISLALFPLLLWVLWLRGWYPWREGGGYLIKIPLMGAMVGGGALIYLLAARLLGCRELNYLIGALRPSPRGGPPSVPRD